MNEALTKELKEQFPFLRSYEHEGRSTSLFLFGFECGDGWFYLIRDLCEEIAKLNPPKGYEVYQVKEKFGGLRFYDAMTPSACREKIYRLISEYENASFRICELCGKGGGMHSRRGWLKTLCEPCGKAAGFEKAKIHGR